MKKYLNEIISKSTSKKYIPEWDPNTGRVKVLRRGGIYEDIAINRFTIEDANRAVKEFIDGQSKY